MRRLFAALPRERRFAIYRSFVDCDPAPSERLQLKIAETREELEAAEAHLRHEVEEAAPVVDEDRRLVPAHDGSVLHDPAND